MDKVSEDMMECWYNGCALNEQERLNPNTDADGNVFCDDCWNRYLDEYGFHCCLCQEQFEERYQGTLFVVVDAEAAGVATGLYKPLSLPYYAQGLVGSGFFFKNSIQRIGRVPRKADTRGYPCAHMCKWCEERVARHRRIALPKTGEPHNGR